MRVVMHYSRVPKTWYAGMHCIPESFCASGKFLRVRKVFARIEKIGYKMKPEIFSALKFSRLSGNLPDYLETFRTVRKLARLSGNFPDSPEIFQTVWKLSRLFRNFPDSPETFRTVWKLSGLFGNFPDCLETCQTVWKLSGQSGKFLDIHEKVEFLEIISPSIFWIFRQIWGFYKNFFGFSAKFRDFIRMCSGLILW